MQHYKSVVIYTDIVIDSANVRMRKFGILELKQVESAKKREFKHKTCSNIVSLGKQH